jgi:hypothetical protein
VNNSLLHQAVSRTIGRTLNRKDLIDQTICAAPSEDCYYRRCDHCTDKNVSDLFISDHDVDEQPDAQWSIWTTRQNRTELQHRNGSFRSLVDQLNTLWPAFVTHSFVTREQRDYIKLIKTSSSLTSFAVAQIDFAENFSFVIQKEVQSAHWNQKQATVFTVFIKVGSDHRNMVIISNYMDHDTTFVYCALQQITRYIRENYPNINKINYVRFEISVELTLFSVSLF